MMRKNFSLCVVFFLLAYCFQAQFSQEFIKYSKTFPEVSKVRLVQETVINIELDKEDIVIYQKFREEDLYLNESASYNSKESLSFSAFFELDEIRAASFSFDGEKYIKSDVEKFTEKDDINDNFYDDTKVVNFVYPNLNKGSKSMLEYSQIIKNPRFLPPFYFGEYFPIENNKVTIIVDKNINLEFKEFNVPDNLISFTKVENRKKIIYTWQVKSQKEYKYEVNAPSYKTILPHIVPIITSYKIKNEEKKILGDVSDLYNWYYSLIKNINTEPASQELIDLTNTITAGKQSDLEKVKAIYYWTQKNIKYIAFEYALGGFIPRESNEVFRKKYGDCKDNSSILFRMLDIAGIKGYLTWIGTRKIPYTYQEAPTPIVDNHMILSYEDKSGETYYLDATGRYTKLEIPTSFIQGKEALVSYGKDYKIKKVPIVAAAENAVVDETYIKILDNSLYGYSKTTVSGYPKIDLFNDLENKNSKIELKEFYNARLNKGNNKFLIGNFREINKYDYDLDFIIDYDFEIKNYAKQLGDEIYINLNLNKDLSYFKTDDKRENAIEYEYKRQFIYTTTLEIPEGFKVDYIPENISVSDDLLVSSITYKIEDNKIIYTHTIAINFIFLDIKQQNVVNNLIKKIEKNYKEIIVLKKA